VCCSRRKGSIRREPFHYMIDQLSRSDARADRDSTVSIDGSSNGTVLEKLTYPYHPSDHRQDPETQKLRDDEDLTSGFDVKQVFTPHISRAFRSNHAPPCLLCSYSMDCCYFAAGMGAKYCDECVCLSAHISEQVLSSS